MAIYPVQAPTTYLAGSGVLLGATSITVTNFVDIYGNVLVIGDFGARGQGCLEPDTNNEEACTYTGITPNANGTYTLTGVKTVLAKTPFTESSGLIRNHAGGTKFVISDTAGFWNTFANKNNDSTITGKYTFPAGGDASAPVSGTVYSAPTDDLEYASKKYVDDTAVAGAPDATTSTKGIVQLPTQAQVDARTATGSTGASLTPTPANLRNVLTHDYAADAGATDAYAITLTPAVTAYTTGDIYYFKANTVNTGACTLNVNAVGAKALKFGGSDPYTGYIAAGAYVQCQYDGTNMNIIWCSSAPALSQGQLEVYGADSVGTDAYAITVTPAIAAYAAGQRFLVKLGTANTAAATLAVSGLSALAIKKNYNEDVGTGDLLAGQIIEVAYDTTNTCWQLLSPAAQLAKYTNGTTTKNAADASATQNIAHGLGGVPKFVEIEGYVGGTISNGTSPGLWVSKTTYNGTTQSSVYVSLSAATTTSAQAFFRLGVGTNGAAADYSEGVVTWDATNIIITWTKGGGATGTYVLLWKANT